MGRSIAAAPLDPDRDPSDPLANAYSRALEAAILAVVLDGRNETAWSTVIEGCDGPTAFYVREHRLVALMIDQMAVAGAPISAETVAERARQTRFSDAMEALQRLDGITRPKLDAFEEMAHADSVLAAIGGFTGLGDIAAQHGSVSGLAANVANLAAYHRQRKTIAQLTVALSRAQAVDGAKKAASIAEDTINALSGVAGTGQGIDSIGRGAQQALEEFRDVLAHGDRPGALWGVKPLDEAVRLRPGALVVLAARPGCGKTSMLLQSALATHAAHGPETVSLCSLEMTTAELFRIILAREIGVSRNQIERGWLSVEQAQKFEERAKAWRANDILVKGTGGRSNIAEIAAWIRAQHRRARGKLLLVGIDYLSLINGTNAKHTTNDRISEITRELKVVARDLRVCVMLLCQMNREQAKEKRKPMLTDLRDSGSVEQDADSVVFLWSDSEGGSVVTASVAKNRSGPLSDHGLEFLRGRGQVFQEIGADRDPRQARIDAQPNEAEDRFNEPPQQQEP